MIQIILEDDNVELINNMFAKIIFTMIPISLLVSCGTSNNGTQDFIELSKAELGVVFNSVSIIEDNLLYASWDTSVCLYNLKIKKKVIEIPLNDLCLAKPLGQNDKIYFPFSDKVFCAFNIKEMKEVWRIEIPEKCTDFIFLNDSTLMLSVNHYGLFAINSSNGRKLYDLRYNYNTCLEPDLSPWPIEKDSDNFYVTNWECKTLTAVKISTGEIIWSVDLGGYGGRAIVISNYIFCGINDKYTNGAIFLIDKKNGRIVMSEKCKYETHYDAIEIDEGVLFCGYNGLFYIYDLNNKKLIPLKSEKISWSSGQLFPVGRFIYFSDSNFELHRLNLNLKKVEMLGKSKYQLQYAFRWKNDTYLIK
jgi:outer membrane protein assembly factor BamB